MAVASAVQKIVRADLSAGMFPSSVPELVPANGAFDITNGLLDEQGEVYRRGAGLYMSGNMEAARMLWTGALKHGGVQLIQAAGTHTYRVTAGTGVVTSLGFAVTSARTPWRGVAFNGVLYMPGGTTWDGEKSGTVEGTAGGEGTKKTIAAPKVQFYATAGSRLLAGEGSRIYFSNVPQLHTEKLEWPETNYHEIPGGATIVGLEGWRTSCVVFTTDGIWIIGGLNHELVDAEGNVQQTLDRYSGDAFLWAEAGIATWAGGVVVPCHEDVYMLELGVSSEKAAPFVKISEPVTNLYRQYVGEGCKPGGAAVYRGHYFLPILSENGTVVRDVLVCRLDARDSRGRPVYAWTHLTGAGAEVVCYAATTWPPPSAPYPPINFIGTTLVGKVISASTYFEPTKTFAEDPGLVGIAFSVTYGDILTGSNLRGNLVMKARLRYRLDEAEPYENPELTPEEKERPGWLTMSYGPAHTLLPGHAPPDHEATKPYAWPVRKKGRYARVKVDLGGVANHVSLRSLELFVRPDGKLF